MDSWARTVQAIMTPVTSPAPRSSLPPRITHRGTTGMSSAKPANHSIAEPSSQPMPGTRQTEPDAGPPSTPIRLVFHAVDQGFSASIRALVTSSVEAAPPRSRVRMPAAVVASIAACSRAACSGRPR